MCGVSALRKEFWILRRGRSLAMTVTVRRIARYLRQDFLSLLVGAVLATELGNGSTAFAGAFEENIQSVFGQGASNAGIASGGALSSMFWNPATITQSGRYAVELGAIGILPSVEQSGVANVLPLGSAFGFISPVGNSVLKALVPTGYVAAQSSDRIWAGLSLNAPFGLVDRFPNPGWAGGFYGQNASLRTYNAAPTVAIKIADWISFGAGLQAQYAEASLAFASGISGPGSPVLAQISGSGWGWGWTAGLTLALTPTTRIGLGYRSALDQKIEGTLNIAGGLSTPGSITTTVKLPDQLSLGLRQGLTRQLALLAEVEWTGWHRIGTSDIVQPGGAVALGPSGAPITIPFQYRDGWFYALGLEYLLTSAWNLRAGIGYEISPITDQVRVPLLPDNQRTWYSVGLTGNLTRYFSIDLAYSFINFISTPINIVPGHPSFNGLVTYVGSASSHFSVISLALRYKFDVPAAPLIVKR
jgi:long-chain fatty acid transport protein